MSTHTTIELEQILPPEIYERLQAEATRLQTSLSEVVREAIEEYLDITGEDEYEDTPDEKIILDRFRNANAKQRKNGLKAVLWEWA